MEEIVLIGYWYSGAIISPCDMWIQVFGFPMMGLKKKLSSHGSCQAINPMLEGFCWFTVRTGKNYFFSWKFDATSDCFVFWSFEHGVLLKVVVWLLRAGVLTGTSKPLISLVGGSCSHSQEQINLQIWGSGIFFSHIRSVRTLLFFFLLL